ncbi:hypothetical protein [Roseibium sp.]|uniref:hypothetical protein n=1 Tax=Roseibium sp. TaxID=1936156 RepID=UPI003A983D4B
MASKKTRGSILSGYLPENPLFRLLAINGVIGLGISALVLAGLFWANIGNLRTLVMASDNPVLPIVMLACGLIITLCSVVMGSAVMMLKPQDDDRNRKGPKFKAVSALLAPRENLTPVSVPVRPNR